MISLILLPYSAMCAQTLFILLLYMQLNKTRSISLVVQEQSNIGCVHIYDVTYSLKLRDIISNCSQWFWWILWSHYAVNYMCCYLAVSRFFVCYFWFSSRSTLGFYSAYLYLLTSHTGKKNCHILIECLFVNLRLTYGPCLGLYCFGSTRCKFLNSVSKNEHRSGHITKIARYSYPRLNYNQQPRCDCSH